MLAGTNDNGKIGQIFGFKEKFYEDFKKYLFNSNKTFLLVVPGNHLS